MSRARRQADRAGGPADPSLAVSAKGAHPSRGKKAWRVEVSAWSLILRCAHRSPDNDRTFGTLERAQKYSAAHNGVISILVPYMFWQSRIVEVTMPDNWRSPEEKHLDILMAGFGIGLVAVIVMAVFL